MNSFDEHHEVILLADGAGPIQRLTVILERQGGRTDSDDHYVANMTFVLGALATTVGGMDSRALRQLADSLENYADRIGDEELEE